MTTVALRFAEMFSSEEGTIEAHRSIIRTNGYVWYGKLGHPLSEKVCSTILKEKNPRILLIRSGGIERYWACITGIQRELPEAGLYPEYYGEKAKEMKTWFKVVDIQDAPKNIMSNCTVKSSGATLSEASKHSMSPYFIIDISEDVEGK